MKSLLRITHKEELTYCTLVFVCPGCLAGGPKNYDGLHALPVNAPYLSFPSWEWNGSLESPSLTPAILTTGYSRCHSFLRDGVFEFLPDSSHSLAGKKISIPDLPMWAENLK